MENYKIRQPNEAFEARIVLNVEAVEVNAIRPGQRRRLEEVLDLVAIDIERQNLVLRLGHELLAEVRADEAAGADHAYGERLDRIPVEIYASARHCLRWMGD